jgi:DNA-3-methyladenine glycosylase
VHHPVGDAAGHAFRRETPRNHALFLSRGHAYVYFIYGNHYCFNVSCLPDWSAKD